ncbi:hypothetical protein [Nonomuraea sediminis]|nr:hypothetical protein [Nonomuraea sediminis]
MTKSAVRLLGPPVALLLLATGVALAWGSAGFSWLIAALVAGFSLSGSV